MKNKIVVSVIIVHYKVKKELFLCLKSLYENNPKILFEIIVVDNDEEKKIENDLFKKFPKIKYIKSKNNIGYGGGNNLGAKIAKGKYLFFLNPDTIVLPGTLKVLVDFSEKNKPVVVAPLLLSLQKQPYPLQGSKRLTPIRAIICLTVINRLFPKNSVAKEYWYMDWDKKVTQEVDVAPGTAFMIRKDVFKKIGGFDERFFLFFEEQDLCLRVQALRYKIFMIPTAQIVHLGGQSTKHDQKKAEKSFRASRFLYFRKHFGLLKALIVTMFLK